MSTVRCINFLDLCRICTSSSEQKINIYSPDGRAKNLSHKISECLPVQIDEKDRLPKTVCAQCAQQLDQIYEMRNISLNSQTILNNWLNQRSVQSDDKVFIKDAINDTGKSLSVLGTPSGGISTSSSNNSSSSNQTNDLLSSIMQAMGMQVQQQPQQQQQQQQQQYTITVDSHVQAHPLSSQQSHSNHEAKSEKQNTLEEFIRLKPDIKITPLGRKENLHNSPANSSNSNLKQQQQQHQQQQQQQQQPAQLQSQTLTAMPGPAAQLQLQPQQINELNVLLQQQALLQQLQQLQAQTQTQFISCNDDGMSASDSKKPKLNFVISSPSAAPQFTSSLAQFGNVGGGQPQIQLQLMSGNGGPGGTNTSSISASQPGQQLNAAALLSLAGTQLVGTNGTTNMLSPNKCFLPITIRDENSDQQIVAHIDTKNLVLPTTYQVQMKLQPQLATADGQPIMQLTPTSIPATLQLTPQALGNANAFQTATTAHQSQFLVPQQLQQQQQHHQQHSQHLQPSTAQVTSQQIIRSPQSNAVNPQVVIRNISSEPGTPITITNAERSVTFKMPSAREQQRQQQQTKLKTTSNSNLFGATTVSTAVAPNADLGKRNTQLKQQANAGPSNVSALQRLSSNTTITKLPKQQQQPVAGNKLPLLNKQNITISRISTQVPPKSEPKSTITAQGQKQPQQQQPPKAQQQSQAGPPAPALVMQPLPATPAPSSSEPPAFPNILNQRKVIRKPPEVNPKTKVARPPQQILPVPVLLTKAVTQQQQQHQTQQVSNTAVTVLPITPSATPTASLTCPTCSREFKKKEHLTQHIKLHAGLRPFKCTEDGCDKAFSRKEHLSRHLVSHSGHKMFTCDECKKPFSRKDNLNKHKRTHSQSSETRVYSCEICNKNFASKQQYEKHREMHNNNKASSTQATAQQSNKAVFEVKQTGPTGQPTQSTQSEMQVQQQSQQLQPQIMHVDLDGSTITITQAPDSSMTNFVQLGYPQFQNSSGSTNQRVCKLEK